MHRRARLMNAPGNRRNTTAIKSAFFQKIRELPRHGEATAGSAYAGTIQLNR